MVHGDTVLSANLAPLILSPLIGAVIGFFAGQSVKKASGIIATLAAFLSFLFSVQLFYQLDPTSSFRQSLFPWIHLGPLHVQFELAYDALTAVMCLIVTGIGTLIHLYSTSYMAEDEGAPRFFCYLNLFLFAMLTLVLGANALVLFIGWEGVGLCSYLLIGFWFRNEAFARAGRKAFVVNRIGDVGFLVGTFLLLSEFGTVDFASLSSALQSQSGGSAILTWAAFCYFIGATGKSAQLPLFVWLPDAMAGPTPVSALIHAATMVTAGVYLFARMNALFVLTPGVLEVVSIVAALTALVAALIALSQMDLKKVLAYSTVSQLGFMFIAASAGAFWVALFHVITHAFFKACLFLGAGSVIHGCHHEQDMREMGGLRKLMPVTFATYFVSTLAIAGIFPFAGYQSKHAILGALEAHSTGVYPVVLIVTKAVAVLTAFYMGRSLFMTFFGEYRGHAHPHESPVPMILPLIVLALFATAGGVLLETRLPEYLHHVLPISYHAHETPIVGGLMGSWPGFLGLGLAFLLYTQLSSVPGKILRMAGPFGRLSQEKFYIDEIYHGLIIRPLESLSKTFWQGVDVLVVDGAVNGAAKVVDVSGEVLRYTQSGQIRGYALWMFVGTVLLACFCFGIV